MVDIDSYESPERRWYNMVLSNFFSTRESAISYGLSHGVDLKFIKEVTSSKTLNKYFTNDTQ